MKFFAALFLLLAGTAAVRGDDLTAAVHAEINLARTAPRKYARIVAQETRTHRLTEGNRAVLEAIRFLQRTSQLPALKSSTGLRAAARCHVRDQGPVGGVGHLGDDWSTPSRRIARYGRWGERMAENIASGESNARTIVVRLIGDDGVRDRGSRLHIFGREFRRGASPPVRTPAMGRCA
ncbi:MAG: CAP domain-containing protein [Verrucomicrobia bacterium]|nr:MAG: CAP domain-containing protein [Verrucomicrobiota bacterium]